MVPDARRLLCALLPWYQGNARTLPWRSEPTPYRVLLSELMLQQTRVDTVLPYFERFLGRWPTLEDLAAADEAEVLHAWAGLGYYSRARNLHRCAQVAAESGGLPRTARELRKLPGVGPYTAGAIASIAFGEPSPLVDGNVERVLSRIDGREEDPRSAAGKRALWERAGRLHQALEPGEHPGDLNQALMELGATVCAPRAPACGRCPVEPLCVARATDAVERLPALKPRARPVPVTAVYGLGRLRGGWVLGRRPPGLLGGLWEPVGADGPDTGPEALVAAFRDRAGLRASEPRLLGTVRHTFSHRRLTAQVFSLTLQGLPRALSHYTEVRVVSELQSVALSKLTRKLLALAPTDG